MAQLVDGARAAVGHIGPDIRDANSTAVIETTWTASRAAGFLEACALIDPALADELLVDFMSVASLVDRIDVGVDVRFPGATVAISRRSGPRRILPDRRIDARRQLPDRRAG